MKFIPLAILCNISIGRTPPRKEPKYWGKGHKWVSISDMKEKVITSTKEEITNFAVDSIRCRIIPKGTLLLSFKLSIGKRAFAGEDLFTNEAIAALIIKDSKILDNKYLYFALGSIKLIGGNNAAMGTTLNSKSLAALKIPLPPLDDQKRIASLLNRAEKLIAQRKESIRLLDELLKSTFLEMFGPSAQGFNTWSLVEIKDLALKQKGSMRTGPFGSNLLHSEFQEKGDVAVLGIDNAVDNTFKWKEKRFITKEKYSELTSYRIFPEDVIITIMGTTGRSAVVPADVPLAINTKHLAAITVDKKKANPYFLSYSFHSNPYLVNQLSQRNRGAIMNGLNLGIIKETKIHKAPIELQNRFAEILSKAEFMKSRYRQSLTELENLYGSVSQKAFKGELDLSKISYEDQFFKKEIYPFDKEYIVESGNHQISMKKEFYEDDLLNLFRDYKKLCQDDIHNEINTLKNVSGPSSQRLSEMLISLLNKGKILQLFDFSSIERDDNNQEQRIVFWAQYED